MVVQLEDAETSDLLILNLLTFSLVLVSSWLPNSHCISNHPTSKAERTKEQLHFLRDFREKTDFPKKCPTAFYLHWIATTEKYVYVLIAKEFKKEDYLCYIWL